LTVLGRVTRKEDLSQTDYAVDIQDTKTPFREELADLLELENDACAGDTPTASVASDALNTLATKLETGITVSNVIVDAMGAYQAYLGSWTDTERHVFLLPFRATTEDILATTTETEVYKPSSYPPRSYSEISESELPRYKDQVDVLTKLGALSRFSAYQHATGFDHRTVDGTIVEVETASGFRIPVQPTDPDPKKGPATEVLATVQRAESKAEGLKGEAVLLKASPDPEGKKWKASIDYRAEVVEFLLMTLARDLQTNEYKALRVALSAVPVKDAESYRVREVLPLLTRWYSAEAYADDTASSYTLLSKVRTPCGQLTNKKTCEAASLCGWTRGPKPCKVRVRSSLLKTDEVLTRLSKTLVENDKQRALVLDNRVSPFFSTVLYLEMPHEWITTSY
jgi:hypothetical protein